MEMLKNKNAKQRFRFLLAGMGLLLILAYCFSIRNTIAAYLLFKKNKKSLQEASNAPHLIRQFQEQLTVLESLLIQSDYDRQLLFETVNTFCDKYGLRLDYFHPEKRFTHNDYEVITNQIKIEGAYKDITVLIYHLEQEKKLGHIASVSFDKQEERRTKRKYLTADIYVQNIQPVNLSSNE